MIMHDKKSFSQENKYYYNFIFRILLKKLKYKFLASGRPWMNILEIIIIGDIIKKLNPKRCLEWGGRL